MKNTFIRIAGVTFFFPQSYEFLSKKQLQRIAKICYANNTSTLQLKYKLLKGLCRTFFCRAVVEWLSFSHLQQLLQITDFITSAKTFVMQPNGNYLVHSKKYSFIEFIRLYGLFSELSNAQDQQATQELILKIIATVYHAEGEQYDDKHLASKVAQLKGLNPYIAINILNEVRKNFDTLIASFPTLFNGQGSSNNSVEEQQTAWTTTALAVAENILQLDAVLHSPAEYILFDIQTKVQQAEALKKAS